ncbi:MAG: RHS repeat domain-containing protein [Caldilineaceae bacterium]
MSTGGGWGPTATAMGGWAMCGGYRHIGLRHQHLKLTNEYDSFGNVKKITDNGTPYTFTYDDQNRRPKGSRNGLWQELHL